ncbi:hypothetical protein AAMO2058_001131700 [Amorphochlora amoebiformis]
MADRSNKGLNLVLDLVRTQTPWSKIPPEIRKRYQSQLGTEDKWERLRIPWALQLHLPHHTTMLIPKSKFYYRALEAFRVKRMPYPYHYQREIIDLLGILPRRYYSELIATLLASERGFDEVPSFTARDVVRLINIDRNAYIRIANACKRDNQWSNVKRRHAVISRYLPPPPLEEGTPDPWWNVWTVGARKQEEGVEWEQKELNAFSTITQSESTLAGEVSRTGVNMLHCRGRVWFEVKLTPQDRITVPPLEGFVMNKLNRDQFERLMYEIFVTADESYTLQELATVLNADLRLVLDAASLYCRLGFAKRVPPHGESIALHVSWESEGGNQPTGGLERQGTDTDDLRDRIALVYDASVVSWLMMGSFSATLKQLSVSMFEVGRLRAKSVEQLITEIGKLDRNTAAAAGGEFLEYFEYSAALRRTLLSIQAGGKRKVSMFRLGSLANLDHKTRAKLLERYTCVVSIAPSRATTEHDQNPPSLGPPSRLCRSPWMKLFLYQSLQSGPASVLFSRGTRITTLPHPLRKYRRYLVVEWDASNSQVASSNPVTGKTEGLDGSGNGVLIVHRCEIVLLLNSRITLHPVFVQGYETMEFEDSKQGKLRERRTSSGHARWASAIMMAGCLKRDEDMRRIKSPNAHSKELTAVVPLPFPTTKADTKEKKNSIEGRGELGVPVEAYEVAKRVVMEFGVGRAVGYVRTLTEINPKTKEIKWIPLELEFGVVMFQHNSNTTQCKLLETDELLSEEALKSHANDMTAFAKRLDKFVSKYSSGPGKGWLPRHSLLFDGHSLRRLTLA